MSKLRLFHRTSAESAKALAATRDWKSKENTQEAYFSTLRDGQASGYGTTVVSVLVPEGIARLDDEFPDGEQHYAVKVSDLRNYPVTVEGP